MMNDHRLSAETAEQKAWREAREAALSSYIQDALASRAADAARDARRSLPLWQRAWGSCAQTLARALGAISGWWRQGVGGTGKVQ
jgi:hypothetical protein